MNFARTELQRRLVDVCGRLADLFAKTIDDHDRRGNFPHEHYTAIREAGIPAWGLPESSGGRGAGVLDLSLAMERLGRGDASTALVVSMHLAHTARILADPEWPRELREQLCKRIASEGALLNTAISEEVTGSPSRGGLPETTVMRERGGWTLNGRKRFTTGAPILSWFIVSARMIDRRVARILVPRETKGLTIDETWDALSMRSSGSHDLVLRSAHVPGDCLLGIDRKPSAFDPWGLLVAAVYLGIGQAARDYAVNFAKTWSPNSLGGRSIASLPHVQEQVGHMEVLLGSARATFFSLAAASADQRCTAAELATAKYVATNAAVHLTDLAMRVVGGHAISDHYALQRHFRDARAGLHHPPLDDAVPGLLGRAALES